jgi:hypothetical protein
VQNTQRQGNPLTALKPRGYGNRSSIGSNGAIQTLSTSRRPWRHSRHHFDYELAGTLAVNFWGLTTPSGADFKKIEQWRGEILLHS